MLGEYVSNGALEDFFRTHEGGVKDHGNQHVILPEEFHKPEGPESLYWEELAAVRDACRDKTMIVYGGFEGLLLDLLDELARAGKMSRGSMQPGDFYLINVGGITVDIPHGESGPDGNELISLTYFPRIQADAEAYAAHFFDDALYPVYVTQVISVPNNLWEN